MNILSGSKNPDIASFAKKHPVFDLLKHDFFAKERARVAEEREGKAGGAETGERDSVPKNLRDRLMA